MLRIHISMLVCAAARLFWACFVSVNVSTPYVIGVVHLSPQADGKVAFEQFSVFGVGHPAMILRCISLSSFFSLRLKCCPKYTHPSSFCISPLFTFVGVLSITFLFFPLNPVSPSLPFHFSS